MNQCEIEYILERTLACMRNAKEKILFAVRRRAKFEGWLKLELANSFREAGIQKVEMEKEYPEGWHRSDVFFVKNNIENHVEIKTAPTTWDVQDESVEKIYSTAISESYKGVISSINQLKRLRKGQRGFALMVFYPIMARMEKEQLEAKMRRGKYARDLLENSHEVRLLNLNKNIGISLFLFGPYYEKAETS